MYQHWFVSRQVRSLINIPAALVAFYDVVDGNVWAGNTELQLKYEDELGKRGVVQHGNMRARRTKEGGGGIRTWYKELRDLGLIFTEEDTNTAHLTLLGEQLVSGKTTFVDAMRYQLMRYQYPSATCWSGAGGVDHKFKIHPFWFMLKLCCDDRFLRDGISTREIADIVLINAIDESDECYEKVVNLILNYRKTGTLPYNARDYFEQSDPKTLYNIANTMVNYLDVTQYIDRTKALNDSRFFIKSIQYEKVKQITSERKPFIKHPESEEIYQRSYGLPEGVHKDLRQFRKGDISDKELKERRICEEYILYAMMMPVTEITPDVTAYIVSKTGIDEKTVEHFLQKNFSRGNVSDFMSSYKELAYGGTATANDFEVATCNLFSKVFGYHTEHVGPIGNTPDVYIECEEYCAIIDNKAYKNGYSIIGDHKRRMEDVYIPKYGKGKVPLAFFNYISSSFSRNIDAQIAEIKKDTGVNGSAITVDNLIDLVNVYHDLGYDHDKMKNLFSVNREIQSRDIRKQ